MRNVHDILNQMKDGDMPMYFSLRKNNRAEDPDIFIDANRNGVLSFCKMLLESLEKSDRSNEFIYDIPDDFQRDDSDVWITHIKVDNGKRIPVVETESSLAKFGCVSVLIAVALVFLIGLITTFNWLTELIK